MEIERGEHSAPTASGTLSRSRSNYAQGGRSTSAHNNTPLLLSGAQSRPEVRMHNRGEPEESVHPDYRTSQNEEVIDPPPSYQEVMSGSYIQMIP